jgi:hypothetical protein
MLKRSSHVRLTAILGMNDGIPTDSYQQGQGTASGD